MCLRKQLLIRKRSANAVTFSEYEYAQQPETLLADSRFTVVPDETASLYPDFLFLIQPSVPPLRPPTFLPDEFPSFCHLWSHGISGPTEFLVPRNFRTSQPFCCRDHTEAEQTRKSTDKKISASKNLFRPRQIPPYRSPLLSLCKQNKECRYV